MNAQTQLEVAIRVGDDVPAALAERARRRVLVALGRLARHVRMVRVRLTDINGPARGGIDKQCIVAVQLVGGRHLLLIEDVDRDFPTAIDRAADRAGHAVSRAVQTFNQWARPTRAPR